MLPQQKAELAHVITLKVIGNHAYHYSGPQSCPEGPRNEEAKNVTKSNKINIILPC